MPATGGFSVNTRRLLTGICVVSLALNIGCYSYQPVQVQPPQAMERVSISLNDRGREQLTQRVGPILDRVEGRIVRLDSTNVVIAVSRVVNLRGETSNWVGEEVVIPRDGILGYQARPFSRGRTAVLVGALVGGLIAFALSISLAVSGTGKPDAPPDGGGNGQG